MRPRRIARLLAAGLLLPLFGCQYVSGVNDLEIVGITTTSSEPDWSCVGQVSPPTYPSKIQYKGVVRNVAGNGIVNDVAVRLCESTDESCEHPVVTTQTTDGSLAFEVDASFSGYVELESPGMMPAIVELSRPLGAMRELPEFRMITSQILSLFAGNMGVQVNQTCGHALFWADDCAGRRAPGVAVSVLGNPSTETRQYYVVDQKLPSASLDRTDASGGGGFINLPTTYVTFEAKRAETGQIISTFSARIRTGKVTFMIIEPD